MANDTFQKDIAPKLGAARAFLKSSHPDPSQGKANLALLQASRKRLEEDIVYRKKQYIDELNADFAEKIDNFKASIKASQRYQDAEARMESAEAQFLQIKEGEGHRYPKNIPFLIYVFPLMLVGIAEWYVNYSTFATIFVPLFAIASTLIVATVFASASHLHGSYLKQLAEINNPTRPPPNLQGRKIATAIATVLLIAAFVTIAWLRYQVILEQYGIRGSGTEATVFGRVSSEQIWSKLGPTLVINILIWGLGTLYSWAMHDRIPEYRESYQTFLREKKRIDSYDRRIQRYEATEKKKHDILLQINEKFIKDYNKLLHSISEIIERLEIYADV